MGSESYTSPGTYTWTVPAGVTSITSVLIYAGGGGASGQGQPGQSSGGNGNPSEISSGDYGDLGQARGGQGAVAGSGQAGSDGAGNGSNVTTSGLSLSVGGAGNYGVGHNSYNNGGSGNEVYGTLSVTAGDILTITVGSGGGGGGGYYPGSPGGKGSVSFSWVVSPPTATSCSPSSGCNYGGTSITITGTNFVGGETVTVNGVSATSVSTVNSTTITCTVPAGTVNGAVNVVVTNTNGSGTDTNGFTYTTPPNRGSLMWTGR